jgi:Na+/H+ antiporter NhaD/arsenite permease-like protein
MPNVSSDRLLTAEKIVLQIVCAGIAITIAVSCFGFYALYTDPQGNYARIFGNAPPEAWWLLFGLSVVNTVVLLLCLFFMFELVKIVKSVGEGDPFCPANARRLERGAWLALAMQVGSLAKLPFAAWLEPYLKETPLGIDFSLWGLVLALTLFILARVFRKGTTMRDDLEGTV